jgi:hypothetical protein
MRQSFDLRAKGGRIVSYSAFTEAIVVCIRPEIGFGSGEPLPPFGTPGFIEVSAYGTK